MNLGLSIGLAASSIIFFLGFVVFGVINYKKRFTLKYDIRNTFPYEINYQTRFLDNILVNVFLVLFSVSSVGFFTFFDIKNIIGVNLVPAISGSILTICIFFIFFADLKYIRFHMFLLIFTAIASFTLASGVALVGFHMFQLDNNDYYSLVVCIISAIFALFIFGVMMNPKLNFKLEMTKAIDTNGNEILVRPKYFVLAFSEWIFIFSILVSELLLLLLYIPK